MCWKKRGEGSVGKEEEEGREEEWERIRRERSEDREGISVVVPQGICTAL